MLDLIIPDWPAPSWIKAYTTTRLGGVSQSPYVSLNIAMHVGDNLDDVTKNRQLLQKYLYLKKSIIWLEQIHGNSAISADDPIDSLAADAIYSRTGQTVCAVQTADCLPLLICSSNSYCVAAIHAGWKGLSSGIIENTIRALDLPPREILVWLGPAIGPQAFTVGEEVFQSFIDKDQAAETAFQPVKNKRWQANLYKLAQQRLLKLGITSIYGGNSCTYSDKLRFFSYRRDQITGRMLSLIWINLP
ncbi:MAG: peptidoglycan editing factor PgeF [Candidatus Rickettsiella isopodorum]|jgi:polyphenol oxidase|nr:peptidoglycan editing factor PgeF [Gammaproteobacteria bacterium]MDD5162123.1 peptidoglycan editing factor PgeF [Candidatus Rickettsiella isopodorum]MDQ5899715.1 Purine nucleoside phosphorylase [Pseudomonadota bacterium]